MNKSNKTPIIDGFKEVETNNIFVGKNVDCPFYKTNSLRVIKPNKPLLRLI